MPTRNYRPFKKGLLQLVLLWLSPRKKPPQVPQELQRAINSCHSVPELTSLLFSMKGMNEAALTAFDKRIDELRRAA